MDIRPEWTDEIDVCVLLEVLLALKKGDYSVRMPVQWTGSAGKVADTLNDILEANAQFSQEITTTCHLVGQQGRLSHRAKVIAVSGAWGEVIRELNQLIDALARPATEAASVLSAVGQGDLSRRMAIEVDGHALPGQFLHLASTVNATLDQLAVFSSELSRVAREVGVDGRLGGQAQVQSAAGTWKELTDSVNYMSANIATQVRNIAEVSSAVAQGDLSKKITVDAHGEIFAIKNTINAMVDQLNAFASEVSRVTREVGTEGRLGGQANVPGANGTWRDLTGNVNFMALNLSEQVRNIAEVTTAVARGDLSKKITVDVKGEILALKNTINVMVDQLSSFASEVTRVAREVGTEGKLGGQAQVEGAGGTWKDLTDSVNFMAANLTAQVRGMAAVVTAVARGDLKKKMTVAARGEIASLANTINEMTDTLALFADQATTVAREVGVEGKLGGQALVPGADGTWKDLTENLNRMAATLTTQVRAIAEVATAVTRGDLSRAIAVEAHGEVAELKDNINEMIRNLKETTEKNAHQDWLKTHLARFTRMLQGQRDLTAVTTLILSELAPLVSAHHGVFYMMDSQDMDARLRMIASYGYRSSRKLPVSFLPGEGLVGQCAIEKERILLTNVPRDYIQISSGLGSAPPANIVVVPILFEQQVKAVVELASLDRFTETHLWFLDQLMESIGVVINTIEANSRTESLLTQSQSLAQELQQTNLELAEKARLLSDQNSEVERKNREVEQAKIALEEKASQLALSSKYKSEFLANMSHELRTPLNSLLILAQQLADNPESNLNARQVEFARTIYGSGSDLLTLINDILDLSKVESGTVTLEMADYRFAALTQYVERTFRHMAEAKHLAFMIELEEALPSSLPTDSTRLQQILKNLLANAFKFTSHGQVSLRIGIAQGGWQPENASLNAAPAVLAFSVSDTGIGIAADKLNLIFEAFQQADGSTARKYGGTGLGLSISRELARLLKGEIRVVSEIGAGSTFTLYLPLNRGVGAQQTPAAYAAPYLPPVTVKTIATEPVAQSEAPLVPEQEPEKASSTAEIGADEGCLLIVMAQAQVEEQLKTLAHAHGFKPVTSRRLDAALTLARDYSPAAVLLDLDFPDTEALAMLDRIRRDPATCHIPVHCFTASRSREEVMRHAPASMLALPVDTRICASKLAEVAEFAARTQRNVLLVERNLQHRGARQQLLSAADLHITSVESAEQASKALASMRFDCMVLSTALADIDSFTWLESMGERLAAIGMPVVLCTSDEFSRKEAALLKKLAKSIVLREASTPAGLLYESTLLMHRPLQMMSESQRRIIEDVRIEQSRLAGRKVLIVDDDLRNIFALSSLLERHEMHVVFAENGREGIAVLKKEVEVEIVLMDIMMPEMDGYDTMRAIRSIPRFKELPIITLTAKAMKGDREKCLDAGASDYITKPVDAARLLELIRVWVSNG